jgi:hypothetical protein
MQSLDWLEAAFGLGDEPDAKAVAEQQFTRVTKRKPVVVESVWIQTQRPSGAEGDAGSAEQGFYFVEGQMLHMCDQHGKPTGDGCKLETGENPRAVASRLTRKAWNAENSAKERVPGFSRPLRYGAAAVF